MILVVERFDFGRGSCNEQSQLAVKFEGPRVHAFSITALTNNSVFRMHTVVLLQLPVIRWLR